MQDGSCGVFAVHTSPQPNPTSQQIYLKNADNVGSKNWVICAQLSQLLPQPQGEVVWHHFWKVMIKNAGFESTRIKRIWHFLEVFRWSLRCLIWMDGWMRTSVLVWIHIVCDRYSLEYAHFTYFNTIWPLSLSSNFGTAFITLAHSLSYPGAR